MGTRVYPVENYKGLKLFSRSRRDILKFEPVGDEIRVPRRADNPQVKRQDVQSDSTSVHTMALR